jgi:hypothetical protein
MGPDQAHSGAGDARCFRDHAASIVSRRQLLRSGAAALGGVAGLGLLEPGSGQGALASRTAAPRPIPGGLSLTTFEFVPTGADLHFFGPGIGMEMSTITDFNGVVGGSETRGTAHGSDGIQYDFDCDMRFMRGVYVGLDGRLHGGSFGFI